MSNLTASGHIELLTIRTHCNAICISDPSDTAARLKWRIRLGNGRTRQIKLDRWLIRIVCRQGQGCQAQTRCARVAGEIDRHGSPTVADSEGKGCVQRKLTRMRSAQLGIANGQCRLTNLINRNLLASTGADKHQVKINRAGRGRT